MFKRINNWHLSVLVAIVSIFSLALIQQYAAAVTWTEPGSLPGQTLSKDFVLNPLGENLDLDGNDIIGANVQIYADDDPSSSNKAINIMPGAKLCINNICESEWPTNASDNISRLDLWPAGINYLSLFSGTYTIGNSKIYQNSIGPIGQQFIHIDAGTTITNPNTGLDALTINNSTTGDSLVINNSTALINPFIVDHNGKVGIGIDSPRHALDIRTLSGDNAQINIESSGDHDYWGIYQDRSTGDLRFWNIAGAPGNNVIFGTTGDITATGQICDGNGKCIGTSIDGSGTVNKIPVFNGTGTLGNSIMEQYNSNKRIRLFGGMEIINEWATENSLMVQDSTPIDSTPFVIDMDGNVAVGALVPNSKLYVSNILAQDSFKVDDTASDATPFVIDQSGNVGIGTPSPGYKLHVQGEGSYLYAARFDGGLSVADSVSTSYVQLDWVNTVPASTQCDGSGSHKGRMLYQYDDSSGTAVGTLWVCGHNGWESH